MKTPPWRCAPCAAGWPSAIREVERGKAATARPSEPPPPLAQSAAPVEYEAEPPFADEDEDDYGDEGGVSQFDYRAPFTRRRNTLKMWTIAAAVFAALATGTVVAVNYYGLPDWVPLNRPAFGIGKPGLELDFPREEQRSETLESGDKIFRVRGTISNTARETLAVPNLMVVFSDARERKVGDWVVVPRQASTGAGRKRQRDRSDRQYPPRRSGCRSWLGAEVGLSRSLWRGPHKPRVKELARGQTPC